MQGSLEICARCGRLYVDYSEKAANVETKRKKLAKLEQKLFLLNGSAKNGKKEDLLRGEKRALLTDIRNFEKRHAFCCDCGGAESSQVLF